MASPGGIPFTHRAEASTYLERQRRVLVMQQVKIREPEVDTIMGGFPVSMPEMEDDTPDKLRSLTNSSAKHSLVALLGRNCDEAFS